MNPEHRIITLAQHNYGAYHGMMDGNLKPEDNSFNDLNTYLMWLGDGTRIWEVEAPGRFQVMESVLRGRNLFYNENSVGNGKSCARCHSIDSMKGIASIFPKYSRRYERVVILDTFIKTHAEDMQDWEIELEDQDTSDLSTFLTNLSREYVISLERG
jgi:cytochrome c553